jgi:putative hydrolase of the HAD superfamily
MDRQALINLIQRHSRPLEPLPTQTEAVLAPLAPIRSVVFDVYGTLIISGSGDISLARAENRSPALIEALGEAGFTVRDPERDPASTLLQMIDLHRERLRARGTEFPEVRIEEVWEEWIGRARVEGWLAGSGSLLEAIVGYECRVNPCWPMPGLLPVLATLAERRISVGIVSNAQFYTPLLFPALTGRELPALGFSDSRTVWSYQEREGKPSRFLYRKLAGKLADEGLQPHETLYVGNDLLNDIYPARHEGFRTALFAGDQRSLRLRPEDPRCRDLRPDATLKHLGQVLNLL